MTSPRFPVPTYITEPVPAEIEFSIISLVVRDDRYERFLKSLEEKGFNSENTELIAIDNRHGNSFDGYTALRGVLPHLKGKYVLHTHDDIELTVDDIDALRRTLQTLETLDPKWMIAGNAGGSFCMFSRKNTWFHHLDDPYGERRLPGNEPRRVNSLDENFLVMPRSRMPLSSIDLSGFHLFATDLCMQARSAGGTCYVMPFALMHYGKGLSDGTYAASRIAIEDKYTPMGVRGRLTTPAGIMRFGLLAKVIQAFSFRALALRRVFRRNRTKIQNRFGAS